MKSPLVWFGRNTYLHLWVDPFEDRGVLEHVWGDDVSDFAAANEGLSQMRHAAVLERERRRKTALSDDEEEEEGGAKKRDLTLAVAVTFSSWQFQLSSEFCDRVAKESAVGGAVSHTRKKETKTKGRRQTHRERAR